MQSSTMQPSCFSYTSKSSMQKTDAIPVTSIVVIGILCILCTIGIIFGAFASNSSDGLETTCTTSDFSVAFESFNVVLMFAMGYLSTLATRHRHALGRQAHSFLCLSNTTIQQACSRMVCTVDWIRTSRARLRPPTWFGKDIIAILLAATVCCSCICGLVISAFIVEVDADPTESGLASESSSSIKAFTVGWMCVLGFKLRRELVGLVGSNWMLQPI